MRFHNRAWVCRANMPGSTHGIPHPPPSGAPSPKGEGRGMPFKAFPFRGRWLAEGQTDEAGGQRPPACRRGDRRRLRAEPKSPPSRRGGCPHPPAPEDSSTRRGGYQPPVSNRVPFTVGPVWDRPLRRSPDRSLHFRRGGTPGRPETAQRGHRALQKDQTHLPDTP